MARKKSRQSSYALPVGVAVIGLAALGGLYFVGKSKAGRGDRMQRAAPPNGATSVIVPAPRATTPAVVPPAPVVVVESEPAPIPDRILWNRERAENLVMSLPARKATILRQLSPLFAGSTGDMAEASNRLTDAYRAIRRDLLAQLYDPGDKAFQRLLKDLEASEVRWSRILTDSYERQGRGSGGTKRITVAAGSLNSVLDQQIVELVSHMGFVDDDHDFVSWKQRWEEADTHH